MKSNLLTSSRLKDARACQRLHHIRYEEGYVPAETAEALRFGTLIHSSLEAWWRAPHGERLNAALAVLRAALDSDVFEVAKAEAMMCGYDARWADEKLETVAVEMQFQCPLVNPQTGRPSQTWELAGKLDVVVRDVHGRLLLVEHKTSSEDISPGSEYWRRLRMDGQVSIYYEGAQSLGLAIEGCLYDVLKKPGLRPSGVPVLDDDGLKVVLDANGQRVRTKDGKKWRQTGETELGYVLQTRPELADEYRARCMEAIAENPTGYFARGDVVRLEEEMSEALFDIWQIGQQIRESENAHRCPRNPDSCNRYGRTCPYFAVCSGEASLDDPLRYQRIDNVHPELSLSGENQ